MALPANITALRAISNGYKAGGALPAELKVLAWGRNETTKGVVVVDEETVKVFAANQRALGFERVALDYEHNTVPGSEEYSRTKEPREIAGHAVPVVRLGDGLYLTACEWTPSGQMNAANFPDLSPAVGLDAAGRVLFAHSAALCRNGSVYDLTLLSAGDPGAPDIMTPELKALLDGLNANLTALAAQVTTLASEVAALKGASPALPPEMTALSATITALGAKVTTLETQLSSGVAAAQAAQVNDLVQRFTREGRVPKGTTGQPLDDAALRALSVDQLGLLLANTPATVPLAARGKAAAGEGRPKGATAEERVAAITAQIARQ